jgi:periplasmic protein TonB
MPSSTHTAILVRVVNRNFTIVFIVVSIHIGFVYAFSSGLLTRVVELVVPVAMLSQFIEPIKPKVELTPTFKPLLQQQPRPLSLTQQTPQKRTKPVQTIVAPLPRTVSDPELAPNAPTGTNTPLLMPQKIAAAVDSELEPTAALAPSPAPAQQALKALPTELPSTDADYLQNPKPAYPALSRRLNEQGKTIVRVLIGVDGQPQRAGVSKSSGFSRLDDEALAVVMRWRFVPGKRGGVAEAMWFNVPITWVLE